MNQSLRLLILSGALALLATSACTVQGGARSRAAYQAPGPNLIAIGSGVYVVENHSQSVFYSDGHYWMAGNGGWYRSSYYNRGWTSVNYQYVPRHVVQIRQPRSYVRYRARPGMRVQRASAVDHRRRSSHSRPAPHRANTRVPASRGRAPVPAHSVRATGARPARPAARPARPAARPARAAARPARAAAKPAARPVKPAKRKPAHRGTSDRRKRGSY